MTSESMWHSQNSTLQSFSALLNWRMSHLIYYWNVFFKRRVLLCYIVRFFSFFIFYHSKQAAEIGLWKAVYGLPPHMFAVSLCRGQTGNEGLLHSGENLLSSSTSPLISRSHFFSPTFSACFSTIMLLEKVMQVRPVEVVVEQLFLCVWNGEIQRPRWSSWVWPRNISGVVH